MQRIIDYGRGALGYAFRGLWWRGSIRSRWRGKCRCRFCIRLVTGGVHIRCPYRWWKKYFLGSLLFEIK